MIDPDLLSDDQEAQLREDLARFTLHEDARYEQKFYTYYPDTGKLARSAYAKHMEFFAAGAEFNERLFMAANRCVTPWTVLETDRGERQCGELLGVGAFFVGSWDGVGRCTRPASPVFLKSIAPAFRLYLDNGETFDCSLQHRILTSAGWLSLGQIIHHASGQRYWRRGVDCSASCATDVRHGDGPPPGASDTVREEFRPRGDVPELRPLPHWLEDAAAPIRGRIHAYQAVVRRSSLDDPRPIADLCATFPDPARYIDGEWLNEKIRDARRSRPASTLGQAMPSESRLKVSRSAHDVRQCEPFSTLLTLSSHVLLEGGVSILAVLPLGLQPILDLTVEGTECYLTSGVVSHNTGKTDGGAFEVTCHLTGIYPDWWVGKRFKTPVEVWACGTTSETTRDIVQAKLLGPHDQPGTGFIPSHLILETTRRPHGLSGSIESAYVRHASGKKSLLGLKTYEQGRKSFEGTGKHLIWDDEEPPVDVYQEQLLRTLTTGGMIIVTFTPLQGMSDVVKGYLEPETDAARDVKMYVQAGWDDVPHLDEKMKRQILATMLPYQIAARTKGEPSLGSGAIYPIAESDFVVPARVYPHSWLKGYGMDVGWNRTAALFVTQDPGSGIYIAYDEHYLSAGEPPSHAMGIRARGEWLNGVIDPASRGRSQKDGTRLIESYQALGLNLLPADNAVETGILDCWTLLVSGRFKVGDNCVNFLREFRKYHRDEKGNIVKQSDHLMDAWRYFVRSGRDQMTFKAKTKTDREPEARNTGKTWMSN